MAYASSLFSQTNHTILTMIYITTILLVLMTATFITCGVLLWRRRAETGDYYRNIHLYFQFGADKAELDSSQNLREEMQSLKWDKSGWFKKLYLYFYARYTGSQEDQVKEFHKLMQHIQSKYPQGIPTELRQDFCRGSKPIMPLTNILTFDLRVIIMFLCVGFNVPYLYFILESTVFELLRFYTIRRHEKLCTQILEKYK